MKHGRVIRIRTLSLRKIRTNLRKLFLAAIDDNYNSLVDQGYLQSSEENYLGVERIDKKIRSTFDTAYFSICKCCDCKSVEKDAVFWNNEINYQFWYPPLSEAEIAEKNTLSFWICPECYKERMERIEKNIEEKIYSFHQHYFVASLAELGIDKVEDFDKMVEEENKYFDE
ncbi:hypothetical protein LCGC14_2157180 [marine sediment metagenome]|uniref:Uncharacterized protein n=1 Tax=marine sediment metagenome TaxID=412755 RepID=A0A0F9EG19_9ZZZZ